MKEIFTKEERLRRSFALKKQWEDGIMPVGVYHHKAILTEEQVHEIKKMLLAGDTALEISKIYGVSDATITRIKNGYAWKHLISEEEVMMMKDSGRTLTKNEVLEIVDLLTNTDMLQREVAKKLNVTKRIVSHVKKGDIYRDIVTDEMLLKMNKGDLSRHRRLSQEEIEGIKNAITSGKYRQNAIAKMFSVDPSTITRIKQTMIS